MKVRIKSLEEIQKYDSEECLTSKTTMYYDKTEENIVYFVSSMKDLCGKIVEVKRNKFGYLKTDDDWTIADYMIDDFKVGDKVKFRKAKKIRKLLKKKDSEVTFNPKMKHLCNKEATIVEIVFDEWLKEIVIKTDLEESWEWTITREMIKYV